MSLVNSELLSNFSSSFDKMKIDFLLSIFYYSDRKSRQQDGGLRYVEKISATFGLDGGDFLYPSTGREPLWRSAEASELAPILFLS